MNLNRRGFFIISGAAITAVTVPFFARAAELLPGARLVRAFNAIGAARMGSAYQEPGVVGMPIAGDDADAVAIASVLIHEIGYEPVLISELLIETGDFNVAV